MATPTFADEEAGTLTQYWSCPVRFIPPNIIDFIKRYDYMNKFAASVHTDYDNISPRFKQAMAMLDNLTHEYTVEAAKDGN